MSRLNIPVSVLDLVMVREGHTTVQAIDSMVQLAKATEQLGYKRYWIAEHHNMTSAISSATVVLIQQVLAQTTSIRVGAGGIMLPNHSPLVVAEQFGTLEVMYPNRVDLGLGRAPGTDHLTSQALRRASNESIHSFPKDVQNLLIYFGPEEEQGFIKAIPGVGTNVPVYILGSSTSSALLAANLGLPYAFAGHFAPTHLKEAIKIYREQFRPSAYLSKPYIMIGLHVIAADTNEEAETRYSTFFQASLNLLTNRNSPLKPPVESLDLLCPPEQQKVIKSHMGVVVKGDKEAIREQLTAFQAEYDADELIVATFLYDVQHQIRSYEILKEVMV